MSKLREEAVQSVSAVAAVAAAQMASAAVSGAPMRIDQLHSSLQAELSGASSPRAVESAFDPDPSPDP